MMHPRYRRSHVVTARLSNICAAKPPEILSNLRSEQSQLCVRRHVDGAPSRSTALLGTQKPNDTPRDDRGLVHVLVEGRDLTAADGEDVRKVALNGALVGFDLTDVMTEDDHLVALCNEFMLLERTRIR